MHRHLKSNSNSSTAARASLHKNNNVKEQNRENIKQHVAARGRVIGPPEWAVKPFSRERFYSGNDRLTLTVAHPEYTRVGAKKTTESPDQCQ